MLPTPGVTRRGGYQTGTCRRTWRVSRTVDGMGMAGPSSENPVLSPFGATVVLRVRWRPSVPPSHWSTFAQCLRATARTAKPWFVTPLTVAVASLRATALTNAP